jgi:hypothetical protein
MEHNRNQGPHDIDRPNQNANKEPAEGSRETVRANQDEGNPRQGGQPAAGITNRPLEREQQEQSEVPPRGKTKDDVGRTGGGGSLGHDQPDTVTRDTPTRNNATGSDQDLVMPEDDATLKTKI